MSTSPLTLAAPRPLLLAKALDYLELTKPKIAVLELVVVLAAGFVATWGQPHPALLLHVMVGTLLIAASASAANQWLERYRDGRMARTASRPLPAGRLSAGEALAFAAVTLLAGSLYLSAFVNSASLGWALLTWVVYVLAYTPLKTVSPANTAVGAVAGALPVLIGWSATGAAIDARAVALALVLFLWQFPHFMAIAWLYRRDYGAAGYQMLTVVDPTGRRAGAQAVLAALALVPVSLVPVLSAAGVGSALYAAGAILLGGGQLVAAGLFARRPDEFSARLLLRASLAYLPTLLVTLALAPWI
ncbi:MAG TPA: heme o synthase [Pirellulaceae bacterium]|nr:heme o synthase [Pirellulaceae bacterium]